VSRQGNDAARRALLQVVLERIGFSLRGEPWMRQARCSYGAVRSFLGRTIFTEDWSPVLGEDEFYRLVDRHYYAGRDDRGSSGWETRGLSRAVGECLSCPVWRECLAYACEDRNSVVAGVFGGTTAWERRTALSRHGSFLRGLSTPGRVRVLERLVMAKAAGFVPMSTPIDKLRSHLVRLRGGEADESWLESASRSEEEA